MDRKTFILGCGSEIPDVKPKNTIYCDKIAWPGVDLVFDLEQPWPIKNSEALHLNATHVAEHIVNFEQFMDEAHRVLSPGGTFYMEVPYAGDTDLAFSDPTHVRFFTNHTFINYLTVEGVHNFGYVRHAWSILHLANDGAVIRVHLAPVPDEYLTDRVLMTLNNMP